jgi:hypothetical protein
MISKLRIRNFQSWPDTEIEFHPGLNIILGSGDSGKTALSSRAIRWVQENRIRATSNAPMGDAYVSRWAKKTSAKGTVTLLDDCDVTITRPDGSYCRRFREAAKSKNDKEANGYELNGERYTAIGVGVPDAVSQWFNWSEVNVQKQHDQAFLISKGAGEVSAFLNRTVKLDDIDAHISAAASLLRTEKANGIQLEKDQEADSLALEALNWVDGASERMDALEALSLAKDALESKAERLRDLVRQMQDAQSRMDKASKLLELEPRAKTLRREFDWCRGLQEQAHGLRESILRWTLEQGTVDRTRKLVELWPRVQAARDLHAEWRGEDVAAGYIGSMVQRWKGAAKILQESGKLVALAPQVQALRKSWEAVQETESKLQGIRAIVRRWPVVRAVDWEDLESRVRRVRALARGVEIRETMVQGLQNYRLTFAGLQTSITETGKRVSELEAKRPATCPVCGGAMHKEGHE